MLGERAIHPTGSPTRGSPSECFDAAGVLAQLAASFVGQGMLHDAQELLKRTMITEALRRTHGNLTQCASLLGVRRQAVQQMVTRYELRELVQTLSQAR